MKNVILTLSLIILIATMMPKSAHSSDYINQKIDSLFVVASSGELRYRDMVEPAIDEIASIGEKAVPHLIDKFNTRSARERLTIINILKKIGSPAVPYLVDALDRPEQLVVRRICWALGDIKDSTSVAPLVAVTTHKDWQVREKAVDALGKIADNSADEAVMKALRDSVGQVRKAAVVASGRMKINEAISDLIYILGDDFYGARMSSIEVLTMLDTQTVISTISDSMISENSLIGDNACQVLGKLQSLDALDLLLEQVKSSSVSRRSQAAVALVLGDKDNNCGVHLSLLENESDRLTKIKIQSALEFIKHEN